MQSHNAQSHVVAFFVLPFDLNQYVRMQIDEFSLGELTSNAVPLVLCVLSKCARAPILCDADQWIVVGPVILMVFPHLVSV